MTEAFQSAYDHLAANGTTAGVSGVDFDAIERVIDADGYRQIEQRYADDSP